MQKKNTTILDDLDSAEKAATAGRWEKVTSKDVFPAVVSCGVATVGMDFENEQDAELIALMRNNIRALIDVAKAAEEAVKYNKNYVSYLAENPQLLYEDSYEEPPLLSELRKALSKLRGEL